MSAETPRTDTASFGVLEAREDGHRVRRMVVDVEVCEEIEALLTQTRSALIELRRWVGDGDCSDDAGCISFQTTAYRDVIAQADRAIGANGSVSYDEPKARN